MMVPNRTSAAPELSTEPSEEDFRKAEAIVSQLQARIVKATREGRWGKVKVLQRLLTHSRSGRILAVERVTSNKGRLTAGVDGET